MKSREQWEKVKESLSDDPYPLYSLAMVSLREGKAEEAEVYALQALNLDGKSAYAHDVLGLAYASQGRIVLLMLVLVSSYAIALQKPALQQADTSTQLVISGQDVITASDAGGGTLSTRDILYIILIILLLAALGVLAL
jgi:tetratricopeptide (TPR) repeat protein